MQQYQEGSAIYALGILGALVYFIKDGKGFWGKCLGVIKAILWPAYVVYGLLEYLLLKRRQDITEGNNGEIKDQNL